MKKLGVGIIGFGFMGKMHTFAHKAIPFYYQPAPVDCSLKVVCTRSNATAQAARAAGGFERCTTDPAALVAADDVDIVHICTPNREHFPVLRAAMAAGKHIYVDKPVTASLDEADKLTQLLPDYHGTAQVALQSRFFPATLRARQLIEEDFLGPVTHFRAAYLHGGSADPDKPVDWKSTAAAGGGVIRDLGSHVLDLLWWLIGPFHRVNCTSRIWATERPSLAKPGSTMTIDVEDVAVMLIGCRDGTIGSVEATKLATGTEDELRFEIHGQHGAVRFNSMQPNYLEVYDDRAPAGDYGGSKGWKQIATVQRYPAPGQKFPGPKFSLGFVRAHIHCLYSFLQCIADGSPPSPSLAEGLHIQRVLEAVRASAESRSWIDLPQ